MAIQTVCSQNERDAYLKSLTETEIILARVRLTSLDLTAVVFVLFLIRDNRNQKFFFLL